MGLPSNDATTDRLRRVLPASDWEKPGVKSIVIVILLISLQPH